MIVSPSGGDDTTRLKEAIASVAPDTDRVFGVGGIVTLTGGVYDLTATDIEVPSGVTIAGAGRGATLVRCAVSGFRFADDAHGSEIRDMMIQAADKNASWTRGVTIRGTQNRVDNVRVVDFWQGVRFEGTGASCRLTDSDITATSTVPRRGSAGIAVVEGERDHEQAVVDADGVPQMHCVSAYITDCNVRAVNRGFGVGVDVSACDGLYMTQLHVLGAEFAEVRFRQQRTGVPVNNVHTLALFADGKPGHTRHGVLYQRNRTIAAGVQLQAHTHIGLKVSNTTRSGVVIQGDQARRIQFVAGQVKDCGGWGYDIQSGPEMTLNAVHVYGNRSGGVYDRTGTASVADLYGQSLKVAA